ncbi:MAG: type 1 glutamine amidotransferase [Lactobacillus sp.]
MRINVLQHTSNEGPGAIQTWAHARGYEMYVYHLDQFSVLPKAAKTDLLAILGGPMNPNDPLPWLSKERQLIKEMLDLGKPLFGACLGAQQIAKVLGAEVKAAPHKEVGWAPVYHQSDVIPDLPDQMTVLHWHQDMFEIPQGAQLLFSSDLVKNQGFLYGDNVLGLQFHFEPLPDNVREIAINDCNYPLENNALHQTPAEIIAHGVPAENKDILAQLLDFLVKK